MNNSAIIKKMIPVYIASFLAWMHNIVYTPLGYVYGTYPNQDALVMLIAVIPGVVAMVGGVLAGKLMEWLGKKNLVIISMFLMLVGGAGMYFLGDKGIHLAIIFSGISGLAAGTIPAANYAVLQAIAPENMRSKVCGWSDAACSLGLVVTIFLAGVLAADGVWTRAYLLYFAMIPVIIATIIFYPKGTGNAGAEVETAKPSENSGEKELSVFPKCLVVLLVIKIIAGFFYSSFGVFGSDYIINDLQVGSSVLVGSVNTVTQIINVVASAGVFLWIKYFKRFSVFISQMLIGVTMLVMVLAGASIPAIFITTAFMYIGIMTSHSSLSTVMAMAPKGKAVGTVSGLFMSATFLGESLCGYVAPAVSNLVFGSSTAEGCLKVSAILCMVVGIISFPFFAKAYKIAFKDKAEKEAQ